MRRAPRVYASHYCPRCWQSTTAKDYCPACVAVLKKPPHVAGSRSVVSYGRGFSGSAKRMENA